MPPVLTTHQYIHVYRYPHTNYYFSLLHLFVFTEGLAGMGSCRPGSYETVPNCWPRVHTIPAHGKNCVVHLLLCSV